MLLPIAKLPARVLRKPVENLSFPLNKTVRRLLADMLQTVKKADGIGLAAPQVSKSLNLALVYLAEAGVKPFFLINPKVVKTSRETLEIEEGCLSLPEVFGLVRRPKKITVEALGLDGKKISLTDDGWVARVMQHEIDHLNNILIVDKFEKITRGAELLSKYKEQS